MIKLFDSPAAAAKAIPKGSMRLVIIDGKKIAIAHTGSGFHAFENACPHQHEPLHKGTVTPYEEVGCPLHHYRFNLVTGQEASNRCQAMPVYPLQTNNQGVYIKLPERE